MKAAAEKSSTVSTAAATHAARKPFVKPAGQGGFFPGVQAKMTVSEPGDRLEKEADRTADRIVSMPAPTATAPRPGIDDRAHAIDLHRKPDEKISKAPAERREVQREAVAGALANSPMGPAGGNIQSAIRAKTSGGEPLSPDVRAQMEPRFGADFGQVRIHRDAEAASLNTQLSARAFTYQNHIFFSRGQYQPGTTSGRHLLAHELTHTIQQGQAIQRSPDVSVGAATPTVQRLGIQDALDKFAEWANAIPGFRMLTLVLGFNPVNMRGVDRNAANLLRALIELVPGGSLITQALDNHGIINKAASWVEQKIAALGDIGGQIGAALRTFLDSLSWTDIFDLGGVWSRAKAIFTGPIGRLIDFGVSTAVELLKIVKDAILKPLAALAQGTRGYDILCVLLGADPITGDPVPRTAENLLGGFMKLIGQEEVWENIKKGNAIPRAYAWFQTALEGLMGMVRTIPGQIVATFTSLTFTDVITVVGAFAKIGGAFISIVGSFLSWGLNTIWNLLEIVFDVVKPGLMSYIRKTGAALKSILKNPIPFLGNLVNAAKTGLGNFSGNFFTHLKNGLLEWLTGALEGVYLPKALSLLELGKFALSVMGVSWVRIRGKIVKAIGPSGEKIMQGLELAFDVVKALVTGGVGAAWELIKEKLNDLKDQVISGIVGFVTDTIVKKAIPKLIAMFIPGAGFISAILSIYDTIMVFVEKISKIIQVVTAFVDSIVAIAGGNITAAAKRVESVLAGLLTLAISFLAGFLGLGKVTDKIKEVIEKIREKVDKALDGAVNWVVTKAKALFASLFGGKDKPDTRTPQQKEADLKKGVGEAKALLEDKKLSISAARKKLAGIKSKYQMKVLDFVQDGKTATTEKNHVHGEINPVLDSATIEKNNDEDLEVLKAYVGNLLFAEAEIPKEKLADPAQAGTMVAHGMKKGVLTELKPRARDPHTTISLFAFDPTRTSLGRYGNKRNDYGFNNANIPAATEIACLEIGLDPAIATAAAGVKRTLAWHKANGRYTCVRSGKASLTYAQVSLGHKGSQGASDYWNAGGHTQTKADNQAWNNAATSYWGPEDNATSKGSGSTTDLYRIPAKFFGSNAMWL